MIAYEGLMTVVYLVIFCSLFQVSLGTTDNTSSNIGKPGKLFEKI